MACRISKTDYFGIAQTVVYRPDERQFFCRSLMANRGDKGRGQRPAAIVEELDADTLTPELTLFSYPIMGDTRWTICHTPLR